MKELFTRKAAAMTLGLGLALGSTACEAPWHHADPNQLTDCAPDWSSYNDVRDIQVTDMASDMAAMETGQHKLINGIEDALGVSQSAGRDISIDVIPAKYRVAAELIIGKRNSYWYDTTESNLDSPREEFCADPTTGDIYRTPNYVNAVAALQAAGIEVSAHAHRQ
jgi:hypothetical protein